MTTSLARQLAALRTPASQPILQDTAYSGPFLFKEADQDNCDFSVLKENAAQALSTLIEQDIVFARFNRFLLEDRLDDRLESEHIEDLLLLVSPYTLLKPAQWILQLLVTKYKVHYKHPETFFFCVLPFYEYDIYAKSIQAIETVPGGSKYPNWFPKFKASCFPTTKLMLYRHTAADRGFLKLLCDLVLRLNKHVADYPDAKIQRQTSFFVMTSLGALENSRNLSEEQAMYILQVVLSGLKSCHRDLVSLGQIILSYVLPKVSFKEKTLTKISKSIRKSVKKNTDSVENLMLMILMIRTQNNIDIEKGTGILISLEPAINSVVNAMNEEEQNSVHLVDNILYTLALILKQQVPDADDTLTASSGELNTVLGICNHIFKKMNSVSTETVMQLGDVAYRLLSAIKRTELQDFTDKTSVDKTKAECERILKRVQKAFPAEYARIAVDTSDVDMFFIGGPDLETRPDVSQVAAKKALLNNRLINFFSQNLLTYKPVAGDKAVGKLLKRNRAEVTAVLAVETSFLLQQLGPEGTENLLINLLITARNSKDAKRVLNHLCSSDFQTAVASKLRVELVLLAVFLQDEMKEVCVEIAKSSFVQHSPLLSAVASLSADIPDRVATIATKLKLFINNEMLQLFIQDELVSNYAELVSLLLVALKLKLKTNDVKELDREQLVLLLNSFMQTPRLFNTQSKKPKEGDAQEEIDKPCAVSVSPEHVLNVIRELQLAVTDPHLRLMLENLPVMLEKGNKGLLRSVEQLIETIVTNQVELMNMYLLVAFETTDDKTRYFCLQRCGRFINHRTAIENQLAGSEPTNQRIVLILAQIFHGNHKIRKVAFHLLTELFGRMAATPTNKLAPAISFLVKNKAEILSGSDNLMTLLKKGDIAEESLSLLLAQAVSGLPQCFQAICDLFLPLKSVEAMNTIASFGSNLLSTENASLEPVRTIIAKFAKKLIKHLGSEPCFKFFTDCCRSTGTVQVDGLQASLSTFVLQKSTNPKFWTQAREESLTKLLTEMVKICTDRSSTELVLLLASLNLSVNMFQDRFADIWANENLQESGRGRGRGNTDETESQETQDTWTRTIFLLEVLDGLITRQKVGEQPWETLIRPLFALLRKTSETDVLEASYKLNLILTVMLKLFNATPDQKLRELKSRDLEPELLTHCIRKSSNPETRQLALRVLARCSLSSPEFVLQNSMTIFTFMGSHLLKMDSKHSYRIACEAIDVIVPAIRSCCSNKTQLHNTSLDILNSFVNAEEDVPEHRYLEFVYGLVKALDTNEYLWITMLLNVKSTIKAKNRVYKTELMHRRMTDLLARFSVQESLGSVLRILVNIRSDLPQIRRIFGLKADRKEEGPDEWDVLRFSGLLLVSKILSNPSFLAAVGKQLLTPDSDTIKDLLQLLLESSILALEGFEALPASVPAKLKTSVLAQAGKVLELVLSLLPYQLYLSLVGQLLASDNPVIRKRAMEVILSKLEEGAEDGSGSNLLKPLVDLAVKEEDEKNQQIALLSIRKICRQAKDAGELKIALTTLTPAFLASIKSAAVLGAAVLAVADVLAASGVAGVSHLTGVVAWLITTLEGLDQSDWQEKDLKLVYVSLLVGMQKVLENFGGFINPFLDKFILFSCNLAEHEHAGARATVLRTSIAENVSAHVLLPRAKSLMEQMWDSPQSLAHFVGLMGASSKKLERNQLTSIFKEYLDFFNIALSYRAKHPKLKEIDEIETEILTGFLTVGLRLCLADFKPVFMQFVNKQKQLGDAATLVTTFNLIERVGARLKNLFEFCVSFILTESMNIIKSAERSTTLLSSVLRCMATVFAYNHLPSMPEGQFEEISKTLVSLYQEEDEGLYQQLEDAVAVVAAATEDDSNWKQLNFCVLLGLRSPVPATRIRVLNLIRRFVTSRSDTYMVVLPDAVPFLTEILEDDDQEVENTCKELVQHMETTFGQNIETYFM